MPYDATDAGTMVYGSAEEPDDAQFSMAESIPVHVVSSGQRKSIAPEFGRWRTVIVSNVAGAYSVTPGAQRLCNRSQRRKRLHIIVNGSVGGPVSQSAEGSGVVVNPGASVVIANISAAQLTAIAPLGGEWLITWKVSLQGTIQAGDANNMKLTSPLNTTLLNAVMQGVAGEYPQNAVTQFIPAGQGINVQAIAAASNVAATYGAEITATLVSTPNIDGVIVGSRDEITSGQPAIPGNLGGYLQVGDSVRYEAQAELWVCYPATNVNTVYVTLCDEVYASGE